MYVIKSLPEYEIIVKSFPGDIALCPPSPMPGNCERADETRRECTRLTAALVKRLADGY